jgi:regulator of protease activity HflC (stomatin/prohibitin superfamily)
MKNSIVINEVEVKFSDLTTEQILGLTDSELVDFLAWKKAEDKRKKEEQEALATQLKARQEAIKKLQAEREAEEKKREASKELELAINPKFGREINFRATFDSETAKALDQKSLYRSITSKSHAESFNALFELAVNIYYGNGSEALKIAQNLVEFLTPKVESEGNEDIDKAA